MRVRSGFGESAKRLGESATRLALVAEPRLREDPAVRFASIPR